MIVCMVKETVERRKKTETDGKRYGNAWCAENKMMVGHESNSESNGRGKCSKVEQIKTDKAKQKE